MININHLRIFYHVAKNRSYTLAAQELFITQPGVSRQVKTLEDALEISLISMKKRQAFLTDEGKAIFEYAKKLFDCEKEIEAAVADMKAVKRGNLRIGTSKAFTSFMEFLMGDFNRAHPKIKIQVIEGTSDAIASLLLDNGAEIGIIAKVKECAAINFIPFMREEISFVVDSEHHLAGHRFVTLQQLEREPFITRAIGSGSRHIVLDLFKQQGIGTNIILETSNTDYAIDQVKQAQVGAFLLGRDIAEHIDRKTLVKIPIKGHELFLDIYVACLKEKPLSIPARAFLKILTKLRPGTKYFPRLVSSWPEDPE